MRRQYKLLFPIELAEVSELVAPQVLFRVEKLRAELHIVHVVEDPNVVAAVYCLDAKLLKTPRDLAAGVADKLAGFCRRLGLSGRREVLIGDPVSKILEYAVSEKIDQIIVGAHGRQGLDHVILGSVARRLIRRSPVPVLTINPYRLPERLSA